MDTSFLIRFAVTYNCNAYGASTYNNNDACATTTGTDSGTSGGSLTNTGTSVLVGVTAGVLLLVLGVVLLMRMRKSKKR